MASLFVLLPEGFVRRKKTSLWFVGSLLVVSVFILTIGLAATTRTENVTVGGYYPGIIVSDAVPEGALGNTGCCGMGHTLLQLYRVGRLGHGNFYWWLWLAE